MWLFRANKPHVVIIMIFLIIYDVFFQVQLRCIRLVCTKNKCLSSQLNLFILIFSFMTVFTTALIMVVFSSEFSLLCKLCKPHKLSDLFSLSHHFRSKGGDPLRNPQRRWIITTGIRGGDHYIYWQCKNVQL